MYTFLSYIISVLVCTSILLSIVRIFFSWSYSYWEKKGFPYLEPKLPLGTNKTLLAKFPGSNLENYGLYKEIRKKGYRFAGAFSITRPYLVIVDPEIVKDIMIKDFDYFCDRGFYYTPNDPITIHLFSMDGPEWKNTRTHFNSIFSSAKLKMLLPLVIRMGELMMQEIQYAAKVNENVDIKEVSTRYTMNTTATCAFGVECDDPKAFAETTQKYFTDEDFTRRVKLSIMNRFPDFAKKLGLKLSTEEISGFYNGILRNNVSYREKNNITRPDYLQSLINLKNETKNTPNPFTEDQIVAESFVFFLGSLDTGSNTISFALYELAQNPDIQEKVRHEIRKSSDIGDLLSLESLAEMKYLHQVINETLRLYPPLPCLDRRCVKDYKINGTDLTIEKGIYITIPIIGIHRDPGFYPNPEKFDPDRFSTANKNNINHKIFLPFGSGPRNCLGRRFGFIQVQIALIMILKNFRVTLSDDMTLPLEMDELTLLITLKKPIVLKVERLQE